jgi:hypothetical protein
LLAAAQGELLAALAAQGGAGALRRPGAGELRDALAEALCDMIWRAAGGGRGGGRGRAAACAAVVLCVDEAGRAMQGRACSAARLSRSLGVVRARSRCGLGHLLRSSALPQWSEPGGWGLVLLLASLVMSRGVEAAAADTDEAGAVPLVGAHGHCNLELVTLALTGRAVSNAFDGERRVGGCEADGGDGGEDGAVLRGVAEQSRVGLLSLHEW